MSSYNEANEMASELVYGTDYDGTPIPSRMDRLIFIKGDSTAIVMAKEETHKEWAEVASAIERLLHDGYRLGCEINISWNGRYDSDGDPEPWGTYMPCRRPMAVRFDGCAYCQEHALATGK
jgi:hypothetical protein